MLGGLTSSPFVACPLPSVVCHQVDDATPAVFGDYWSADYHAPVKDVVRKEGGGGGGFLAHLHCLMWALNWLPAVLFLWPSFWAKPFDQDVFPSRGF